MLEGSAGIVIKKLIINQFMIKKIIVKVLSLIGWIIVGGMHGLCWLVNKIYGVVGGFITALFVILFLISCSLRSLGRSSISRSIFIAARLSVWLAPMAPASLCWLVNKIYGVVGGFITALFVILFLIVSIGYKDVQQSIFLAVLESLNILVMIAGNTLEIVLELACDRLASNLVR